MVKWSFAEGGILRDSFKIIFKGEVVGLIAIGEEIGDQGNPSRGLAEDFANTMR